MARTFKLNHTIAENVNAKPKDVLSAKRYLYDMGYYEPPQWGMTEFPDHALIDAIRNFQRAYGLRVDGVMKPGGESEETIRKIHSQARTLQGMGRNGDTVLAHITPTEARMLKARGGAGTTNPATGLLEFYNADKKQGSYIWRTSGDSKVRSSHAERNGKTFSWDAPPEGGHPGEAYNCRCRAEDVKPEKCERLRAQLEVDQINADAASARRQKADDRYNQIADKLTSKIAELDDALVQAPIESVPFVRALKRRYQGKSVDPSDFAGPIPALLEIQRLFHEVAALQKENDEALAERKIKEKQMNEAKAIYRVTYAKYEALGCGK